MASLGSYLPSPGKVTWRRDAAQGDVAEGNKVRHVMIKSAEVWEKPTPHVVRDGELHLLSNSGQDIDCNFDMSFFNAQSRR